MVTVTQYLEREYSNAEVLYKRLSAIRTLSPAEKREVLIMVEAQLDAIDHLDGELGTREEERKLSFINRTLIAARRLCLE